MSNNQVKHLKTNLLLTPPPHTPALRRVLFAYANLARLGMSPLTISVPLLGAWTAGRALTPIETLALALIGLCAHSFGFALNDLIDQPIDRAHPLRRPHTLSNRAAWTFTLIQIPLSLSLAAALDPHSLPLLLLSITLSIIYNLWSKSGTVPRLLAEWSLAASISTLCLTGGTLTAPTLIFALTLGAILHALNALASGLKDLKYDSDSGATSFVIAAGAHMLDHDAMTIPPALKRYALAVQIVIFALLIATLHTLQTPPLAILIALILCAYGALHLRMLLNIRSFIALRHSKPLLNGYYQFGALLVATIHLTPPLFQLLTIASTIALFAAPITFAYSAYRVRYNSIR